MCKKHICVLFTLLANGVVLGLGLRLTDQDSSLNALEQLVKGNTISMQRSARRSVGEDQDCNFTKTGMVNANDAKAYNCVIENSDSQAVRIEVNSSKALVDLPILFVVKQQKSVLSWAVPHIIQNKYKYDVVSHTLCPEQSNDTNPKKINVAVTTSSDVSVKFHLKVTQVPNFKLEMDKKSSIVVTPSQSQYYKFKFPDGIKSVIVKATSNTSLCAVVSLQSINCPVYDQFRNVEFTGVYQTMTTKAAVTVEREYFKGAEFFVVLVVQPDDKECGGKYAEIQPSLKYGALQTNVRSKTINIEVEETYASTEYWRPVFATIGIMLLFYLVTGILVVIASARQVESELRDGEGASLIGISTEQPLGSMQHESYGSTGPSPNHVSHGGTGTGSETRRGSASSVSDEDDIDYLEDIEHEKEVYRTKAVLFVSDLSRKDPKLMRMKYRLYHWNLITIAVFYALPVIQLVVTYQTVLNITGNEDICYYNFLCANPAGVISAFNNVFSNIGYMMLGILFLLLVYRREYMYKKELQMGNRRSERCGIPKHFGLFYALGISLFMEGVLSACYHVCPNYSNFQFDTSFMYIIAGLGMLKLYQQRHPDINANAYASYACFAGVIFIAVLGVVS
ncbi:SID1 transmembrane family member 1-like isoform X2 [Anneissia japonica]|uniref:SID1 transmembrane family member 1-like isoform X2 n=1 Tax=Anneissia japonica TaxID=1529436 RepID=UPI001425A62C|nr:SID1 transmembrane family member 1-like isoform X2 [Anneissia japonica]